MKIKKLFKRTLTGLLAASMFCTATIAGTQTFSFQTDAMESQAQNAASQLMTASENPADNNGINSQYFGVSDIVIGDKTAEVSYHAAADCTIVLGFYDDAGTKLITNCQQEISATESSEDFTVSISLPKDKPEFFMLKAFILGENQIPLSTNYESTLYTKDIAAIQDSEISDFRNTDRIVNLDENEDTNFIILKNSTIRIPYDGKNNVLTSADKEACVYVFSNIDSRISGLKPGNVVFSDSVTLDGMALFKVAKVEVSGKTATVTASEMELDEAVELVKIDNMLTYGKVDDPAGTDYGDGVIFEGVEDSMTDELVPVSRASVKGLNPDSYLPSLKGESGHFTDKWRFKVNGDIYGGFSGNLDVMVTLPVEYTFYWSEESSFNVVSIFPEVYLDGDIKFKTSTTIPIRGVKIDTPMDILDCSALIGVRLEGSVYGKVSTTISDRIVLTSDSPFMVIDKPTINGEIKPEGGSVFVGLSAEINASEKRGTKASLSGVAKIGFQAEGKMIEASSSHDCTKCFDGEAYIVTSGKVNFNVDYINYEKEWKFWDKKWKLFDFYYSMKYYDWGYGDCPHKPAEKSTKEYKDLEQADPVIEYPRGGKLIYRYETDDRGAERKYDYWIYPGIGEFKLYDDGHAYLGKLYDEANGTIPEYIDGYLVTEAISAGSAAVVTIPPALASYYISHKWIKKDRTIILAEPLTYVPKRWSGGADLTRLERIELPNTLTSIGEMAFSGLVGLEDINIPDSVTYIGKQAFSGCEALASDISLPSSLTHINSSTFYSCHNLKSVSIPSSVTYIGNAVFHNCVSLTSITIPSSVEYIGYQVFDGCSGLETVAIPNSVYYDGGASLFSGCKSLKNVTVPDNIASVNNMFAGCKNLENVTITSSGIPGIVSIGNNAFNGCSSLKNVTIPDSIQIIYGSFGNCTSLQSITIPHSVTNISRFAFSGCTSLSDIYYHGTEREWNAMCRHTNLHLDLGENVTVHFLVEDKSGTKDSEYYFDSDELTNEVFSEYVPDITVEDTETDPSDSVITMGEQTHIIFENVTAGAEYILLAVGDAKKPLLDNSNLRYIDQQTADVNGKVEFIFADLPKDTIYILAGDNGNGNSFHYEGTLDIEDKNVEGDVNLDGVFSIADVVMLQNWLLSSDKLTYWQHCDLCEDGVINIFDLVLMKQKLLKKI